MQNIYKIRTCVRKWVFQNQTTSNHISETKNACCSVISTTVCSIEESCAVLFCNCE